MTLDVTFGMALLAVIISFLSPCVLPLVPPYLCFITGASLEQLSESDGAMAAQRRRTLLAALFFVLGFSTVFILMGVSASYVGQLLRAWLPVLAQVAGVFIILMGLNFLGVFRLGFLSREKRYHAETRPAGLIGAYGVGLAFAFGWTPCIGPVLAMILTLAATEQDMARGAGLLAVYSAGLGIPFLLAAAGVGTFLGFFRRFRSQMRNVERAMGLLLVLTGVMFLTGYMQAFSYWLIEEFPWLATIG
jgi:cytochrome c-type biogenesis protein